MKFLKKYYLYLLVLSAALALAGDSTQFKPSTTPTGDHSHKEEGSKGMEGSHNDPEKQRRMGIYHYNEGNKLLKAGNWEEAVENYKKALNHDKEIHAVYINMSNAYLAGKKYNEALDTLQILKTKMPDNPLLHYNLACYYSLTNDLKSSQKELDEAIKLGFKNFQQIKSDGDLENLRQSEGFKKWFDSLQ